MTATSENLTPEERAAYAFPPHCDDKRNAACREWERNYSAVIRANVVAAIRAAETAAVAKATESWLADKGTVEAQLRADLAAARAECERLRVDQQGGWSEFKYLSGIWQVDPNGEKRWLRDGDTHAAKDDEIARLRAELSTLRAVVTLCPSCKAPPAPSPAEREAAEACMAVEAAYKVLDCTPDSSHGSAARELIRNGWRPAGLLSATRQGG